MELLITVVLIGITLAIASPRLATALSRRNVTGATASFEAVFRRARAAAIQNRLPATITFSSGRASVTIVRSGTTLVIGQVLDFPAEYGLTPSVTSSTLRVEPTGLVLSGTPFSFVAAKSGSADTVRITGYGRIE